ncbi:MAG: N-acetylmuramoyl-L-alanine amidase [Ilumatobacteraceae bacterium]
MRAVAGLVLVIATAWPSTLGEARDRATGPPETLASERAVTSNVPVESEFPIDFLGVLYEGDVEGGQLRFRHDGRWGSWVELHDDGAEVADHWASGLVSGSDAEAYQVQVPLGARAARAVVINTTDGRPQAASALSGECPDATTIVTRCEWGADESLMTWTPEFRPAQKLTVHHTATTNGSADPAATVRAIYRYQAVDRGFGDIGYQYLIDGSGRVYEGRYSGTDRYPGHSADGSKVVTAAHVGGFNAGNTGIALLGNFTSVESTTAARGALTGLLSELIARHGIDPHGSPEYVNPDSGATKMVANISGHRDWAPTECPGGTLYARLPTIRDSVDTVAPTIREVTAAPRRWAATVTWATDERATSRVRYRPRGVPEWRSTPRVATLVTSHTAEVTALARHTTYQYQVISADAAGHQAISAIASFTTR